MSQNPIPFLCILCLCAAPAAHAAPVDYTQTDYHYNTFNKRSGNWDDAANWSLKHAPTSQEEAIIRDDAKVAMPSGSYSVSAVMLGGKGSAALTIGKGTSLDVVRQFRIGRTQSGSSGVLSLEGGTLRTDINKEKPWVYLLHVGGSSSFSSTGLATLRSGTFEGAIRVGDQLANTGTGTLSIVGSGVSAGGKTPKEDLSVTPYGTIEFILDAEGVSTLNYKDATLHLASGASIRINGERYAGAPKTIVLIAAKQTKNQGAAVECAGFPEKYKAKAAFDRRGLVLTIQAK